MAPTSAQVRRQFIDFFARRHGHAVVPSSPVVPHDDPTLLFTNAGMNQFKPIFLGTERRDYARAVDTQKCIRAGGKHNDLDDVGRSRRHHTFFEMLGNWSFGDYFKRDAIAWAWELLTDVWKLDPNRLHVTCYEGGDGVPRDTEAADLWKQVAGLPDDHIHYFGKDNFWEMGDTGPCGPCTEIFYDRTPDATGGPEVNGEDPRVMEIWNLVFIQYNRNPDRSLTPLPSRHVDTGMGFERICQVLQGAEDNYGTDLWSPLFAAISQESEKNYGGRFPATNAPDPAAESADAGLRADIAFRVIADHVRCLTFALTDGAVPSNEGRGYVLRRILRRAVRFGRQALDLREPFLHKLVPVVVESMGDAFPELRSKPDRVVELMKDEEVSFGKTLDRGIQLFDDAAESRISNSNSEIPAADAFKLHDTYGFPIDLTQVMAAERGLSVDLAGYERLMDEAREKARSGGKEGGPSPLLALPPDALATLADSGITPTDDSAKFTAAPIAATVRAIWDGRRLIDHTHGAEAAGQGVAVMLDATNFYAEMGGQVGDAGELRGGGPDGTGDAVMAVTTARNAGGFVLHVGEMTGGHLSVGDRVTATLAGARPRTEGNHTATHLANWALREVLGGDVRQKGSLVDPDRLRFDFSHGKALTLDELQQVETLVNGQIDARLPVYAQEAPQEKAIKIDGLRAVFGEKYPPMVRVVSVGTPVPDLLADPSSGAARRGSVEFCGGTHLSNTAGVGGFAVIAEESVSKGIRRLTALTGEAASAATSAAATLDAQIAAATKVDDDARPAAVSSLQQAATADGVPLLARRRAQAAVAELQSKQKLAEKSKKSAATEGAPPFDAAAVAASLVASAEPLGEGATLIVAEVSGASADGLRSVIDSIKSRPGDAAVLLATTEADKVTFVAAVPDALIARGLKAGDWVRDVAKVTGGGGGGRPQLAQAGGKDAAKLPEALEVARRVAAEKGG